MEETNQKDQYQNTQRFHCEEGKEILTQSALTVGDIKYTVFVDSDYNLHIYNTESFFEVAKKPLLLSKVNLLQHSFYTFKVDEIRMR